MYTKRVLLIALLLIAVCSTMSYAEAALKVNNKEIQEGEIISLFKDDLDGGKMVFSVPVPEGISSAEISLDNGRQWNKMEKDGNLFVYTYRPMGDEQIRVVFLFKNGGGKMSTHSTKTTIIFQKNRPDDAIMLLLEKFKNAYEAENKARFMEFFSMRFPDRVKFEESIQNDFYNYNNIRLFYRIDRSTFDPEYKGAIWDIYWERKYTDRTGNNFSDSANITFSFVREGDTWVINGMRNNTIFGSSLITSPDLVVSNSDLVVTPDHAKAFVQFTVHNVGMGPASNVKVNIYVKLSAAPTYPATPSYTTTIGSINANSQFTSSIITITGLIAAPTDFKMVVDPDNTINEPSETNNTAQQTGIVILI